MTGYSQEYGKQHHRQTVNPFKHHVAPASSG
jgi:hypothetical protein